MPPRFTCQTFGDTSGNTNQVQVPASWMRARHLSCRSGSESGGILLSPKVPSPKVPKTRSDLRKHSGTPVSPKLRPRGTYGDKRRHLGTHLAGVSIGIRGRFSPGDIWGHIWGHALNVLGGLDQPFRFGKVFNRYTTWSRPARSYAYHETLPESTPTWLRVPAPRLTDCAG